jgi:hypothetical protein
MRFKTPKSYTHIMKDVRSDKIILKEKIRMQAEGRDGCPDLMKKLMVSSISLRLRI